MDTRQQHIRTYGDLAEALGVSRIEAIAVDPIMRTVQIVTVHDPAVTTTSTADGLVHPADGIEPVVVPRVDVWA